MGRNGQGLSILSSVQKVQGQIARGLIPKNPLLYQIIRLFVSSNE